MEEIGKDLKVCSTKDDQKMVVYTNGLWINAQMIAVVADELQEQNKLLKRLIDAVGKK